MPLYNLFPVTGPLVVEPVPVVVDAWRQSPQGRRRYCTYVRSQSMPIELAPVSRTLKRWHAYVAVLHWNDRHEPGVAEVGAGLIAG